MIQLLCIFLASTPLIGELFFDRDGDQHPNYDWVWRGITMVIASAIIGVITFVYDPNQFSLEVRSVQAFCLSFGLFVFFFPPLVNVIQGKKKWWSALSKTAWPDKLEYWSGTPWWARMFFLGVIAYALISVYTSLDQIIHYKYNY